MHRFRKDNLLIQLDAQQDAPATQPGMPEQGGNAGSRLLRIGRFRRSYQRVPAGSVGFYGNRRDLNEGLSSCCESDVMTVLSILRCIVEPGQLPDEGLVALNREESHHLLTVRRAQPEDTIAVYNGRGSVWFGRLHKTEGRRAIIAIDEVRPTYPAPTVRIHLALAIPKGKTMDAVIQRCVELQVTTIQPLYTAHSEVHLKGSREQEKTAKWQSLARESLKQCGNPWLPEIAEPVQLKVILRQLDNQSSTILAAALLPRAKPMAEVLGVTTFSPDVWLFIGPEGDFSADEYAAILNAGALPFSLGDIVLKVETAVVAALANLNLRLRSER